MNERFGCCFTAAKVISQYLEIRSMGALRRLGPVVLDVSRYIKVRLCVSATFEMVVCGSIIPAKGQSLMSVLVNR